MDHSLKIREKLNIHCNIELEKFKSIDDVILWCFCHDITQLPIWLNGKNDSDYDLKYHIMSYPIFDYLKHIIKDSSNSNIMKHFKKFMSKLLEELEGMDRYDDGSFRSESIDTFYRKFHVQADENGNSEPSILRFPLEDIGIDTSLLAENPPKHYLDVRCKIISDLFSENFEETYRNCISNIYPNHENHNYKVHVQCVSILVRYLVFSNFSLNYIEDKKLKGGLDSLALWSTVLIRPRVIGEEF